MNDDFQLLSHYDLATWPEWGSAPRRPLIDCDMAHKGELLDTVVGPDPKTKQARIYHILRCELCIITHAWPLPSSEDLSRYYADTFYQVDKTEYVDRYEADRAWWEQCVHGPILEQCRDLLLQTENVSFLEIGAGPGIALDVAQKVFGWKTSAFEPNGTLCEALRHRGHIVEQGVLEDFCAGQFPGEIFQHSIVYLYEVLEHQPNPEDFLLQCWDHLRPGGLLAITVPNDYSPTQLQAQQILKIDPWWLAPPQHLHYFTPKTLQLVIRRAGFQILDMRGTYPLDQHLLLDQNYIGNDALGRHLHQERMQLELSDLHHGRWLNRESQYRDNMKRRVGREIVAIARKPL